jgi:hypothetical protein
VCVITITTPPLPPYWWLPTGRENDIYFKNLLAFHPEYASARWGEAITTCISRAIWRATNVTFRLGG